MNQEKGMGQVFPGCPGIENFIEMRNNLPDPYSI